ncbi:cyclin-domain-containing protein [Aspergillus cavernicola]|uniref:Cyclin-domain-containing protein n=1 Tax=Aspergillus cavernicola TaxID=176166 RepID=A0ABR4I7S9_9EURO
MLGGAVPPSESVYRPSSRQSTQPSSHLENGNLISTSSNTTPTFTAPPSASTAGSARFSSHDVPAYINRSSYAGSHSSSESSSATPGPTYVRHPSIQMNPTASSHPPPAGPSPHSAVYSSHPTDYGGQSGAVTTAAGGRYMGVHSSPASPQLRPTYQSLRSLGGSEASSPSRIKIRNLSHIQSFASEEFLAQSQRCDVPGPWGQERQFEISSMPVTDIIEMVAGLLTKITTTNDTHHEQVHRHIPSADGSSNLSQQAQSVLAFHGKNVPSISILSYLTRIHKYCPTTYEVFLSLLVYFDRMTEMVNKGQLERLRHRWSRTDALQQSDVATRPRSSESSTAQRAHTSPMVTPPSSTNITAQDPTSPSTISPTINPQQEEDHLSQFFVVDSFNIHRLVIAGVTCASKFFSDVFYTNSRYAKVGGLPLVELNHLELQFLLLNDFRLSIPVEELEAYGTMLVEFYAREIVAQQQPQVGLPRPVNPASAREADSDGMYMRSREPRQHNPSEVRQTATPP